MTAVRAAARRVAMIKYVNTHAYRMIRDSGSNSMLGQAAKLAVIPCSTFLVSEHVKEGVWYGVSRPVSRAGRVPVLITLHEKQQERTHE